MQKHVDIAAFTEITPTAPIAADLHGGRAKCLQRLIRLGLPVPRTVALSFPAVRALAEGTLPDITKLLSMFDDAPLLTVRASSQNPDWGGPSAVLNIGMNGPRHAQIAEMMGPQIADAVYARFIQSYAIHVDRLDPDLFDAPEDQLDVASLLAAYEQEMDEPFPQEQAFQLSAILRSMARAWEGTSARLLREANGAPADAGLGLVVQAMALGMDASENGLGVIQFVDAKTGKPQITGRYSRKGQGRDAVRKGEDALYLTRDPRGPSVEDLYPQHFTDLARYGEICRKRLREEMQIKFTIQGGSLMILDAVRVPRSPQAEVRIAVALAEDHVISPQEAVLRVEPGTLPELLHRQVDPTGARDTLVTGIAASPGAATGKIVFSSAAAQSSAARDEPCILVRRETTPDDVRGMHVSAGVLTERGGTTSHAAVIARGLGVPAVVGASKMRLDMRERTLTADDGRVFREGDTLTLDGTAGTALAGAAELLEPALDDAFQTLLGWADEARDIGVRVNADTPAEAQVGRAFKAEGIGLCRTEHMFFDRERMTVMREMIFADGAENRAAVLERLLPMQRADFIALFEIMQGRPICIRLLDPPLHEFLPSDREGLRTLADALDLPIAKVNQQAEALSEFNPMLGMRGVRLGIAYPEIYDMQARAIFEATVEANRLGDPVVPEIMIPLISAKREVEIVKMRIDSVAAEVRVETGASFDYRLGVMVETPRAALRANEIAQYASFLSFGTNDLTQMTYGLSRDDAGRFMGAYVNQQVFVEDPFHRLDIDGVGELLTLGAERGRAVRKDVVLSICGEHGGDPGAIAFSRDAGFDYVSCSPFRVPVARLAAAHLAIKSKASAA
ncbi:MAG: pyruvate, phosphate dikinase [Alphaproteobacteria bacterium]|nr:pyruvate, phosphate dikinase [Alphaproteobacteria bacterium]